MTSPRFLLLTTFLLLGLASGGAVAQPAADASAGVVAVRRVGAMGTTLEVEVVLDRGRRLDALRIGEHCIEAVEDVEQLLSTWREDSALSVLNRVPVGEPIQLDPGLAVLMPRLAELRDATSGAFDPGVGPLIDAWDLRGAGRRPTPQILAAARRRTGLDRLEIAQGRAVRSVEVTLDAGAFGKGAALDRALQSAWRLPAAVGVVARSMRLDLGGQQAWRRGSAPRDGFQLAVAHPARRDEVTLVLDVDALPATLDRLAGRGSIATSGNSERGRTLADGTRIGHLLDPRSGRPAPDWGSVTVLTADALTADALATGLHVLGPEAALRLAAARGHCEVVVQEFVPDPAEGSPGLRIRATAGLEGALHARAAELVVEFTLPASRSGNLHR